jgi:phosphopentomutase
MTGDDAIGRVIARPFRGRPGAFERTTGRRDFAVPPPGPTYLDALRSGGVPVHAVGKVADLFAGRGIDAAHAGTTNEQALAATTGLLRDLDRGLIFTNLIETDQRYGHRHDAAGFHEALRTIDAAVGGWLGLLGPADLLVLTADHGVDPTAGHTDHTREHVPLLAVFAGQDGRRHDGPMADVGASVLRWLAGAQAPELPGTAFVP